MSDKRKISIVVLGTEDNLKKSLISVILGKDISVYSSTLNKTETYENDTYEVTYTPNLYKESEEIKKVFSSKHPDMSVLVLKDEISTQEMWQQMENLQKTTGKPTEEFRVVLPLNHKREECYPDNCCTMEELFSKLRELAEQRHLMPTDKRSADRPQSYRASHSQMKTGNQSDNKVNLVLLGMSRTGKSASGNTILRKKQFLSGVSSVPITTEWQEAETVISSTCVRVIDTPDIFDDDIKSSVKNQHVTKCKQLLQSGPCVFLLVIHVGRFTDGERDILRKLEDAFGNRAKEQTIILFTRGEELQRADMNLEVFLQDCDSDLKKIVDQCGGGCVVFENKTPHQHQVEELMQKVEKILNKQQNQ